MGFSEWQKLIGAAAENVRAIEDTRSDEYRQAVIVWLFWKLCRPERERGDREKR